MIIDGVAVANFTSVEGSVTSATGTFSLAFDGVVMKIAPITAHGAVLYFDSQEIEQWDAGEFSNHTLTLQVDDGAATITSSSGALESKKIDSEIYAFSLNVLSAVEKKNIVTLNIDHTKIDDSLTDFPLMVLLPPESPVLKELSWGNRKKMEITQGGQQLYVEIEKWDESGAILWVKIPSISTDYDTVLTLYYNTSIPENFAYIGDTLDPTTPNVWSNGYVSVFHLNGNVYDSASARNYGSVEGGVTWVEGPLGALCPRFDGSTGVIVVPDYPGYSSVNNDNKLTEECWISPERVNWNNYISPFGKGSIGEHETKWNLDGGINGAWKFYILNAEGSYGSGARSSPTEGIKLAPIREAGEWYMVHGQVIGNLIALYEGPGIPGLGVRGIGGDIDENVGWNNYRTGQGVPDGTHINPSDTTSSFYIGRYGGYNPEWQSQDVVPLRIQEVRISSVNRSIAWMKADYYNQLNQLIIFS